MLVDVVGWTSLLAGVACLVAGLILALTTRGEREAAKEAAKEMAAKTKEVAGKPDGEFQQQAGALSTSLEAVAKLAASLKDLDRVGQLLVVALGFFAIAGAVAGLEQVAAAIGS
jgi:hypothetical protein